MAGIQSGIYYKSGETPPPAYRLLLLNAHRDATAKSVAEGLAAIWEMINAMPKGHVSELEGQPEMHQQATHAQYSDLRILIGYGRRLFDPQFHDFPLTGVERPAYLAYLDERAAFPSLEWGKSRNEGESDFALQFTASSEAAVNSAAVEVWKALEDQRLPLSISITYEGFGRRDGRGWLEFHDGVSNMRSDLREEALTATEPGWMGGGTYMTFLRLAVDLPLWRRLRRTGQEIAVGRDKLTGAALLAVVENESGVTPVPRPFDAQDPEEVAEWREPSQRPDARLERSHIHRSNQSRASPQAPGSFRMFRQGYEFLAGFEATGPRLGLNFVSFQRDIRTFQHVMNAPGWLGDAVFGGATPGNLLTLEAGGFYAVPPTGGTFPGEVLFAGDYPRTLRPTPGG